MKRGHSCFRVAGGVYPTLKYRHFRHYLTNAVANDVRRRFALPRVGIADLGLRATDERLRLVSSGVLTRFPVITIVPSLLEKYPEAASWASELGARPLSGEPGA